MTTFLESLYNAVWFAARDCRRYDLNVVAVTPNAIYTTNGKAAYKSSPAGLPWKELRNEYGDRGGTILLKPTSRKFRKPKKGEIPNPKEMLGVEWKVHEGGFPPVELRMEIFKKESEIKFSPLNAEEWKRLIKERKLLLPKDTPTIYVEQARGKIMAENKCKLEGSLKYKTWELSDRAADEEIEIMFDIGLWPAKVAPFKEIAVLKKNIWAGHALLFRNGKEKAIILGIKKEQ